MRLYVAERRISGVLWLDASTGRAKMTAGKRGFRLEDKFRN